MIIVKHVKLWMPFVLIAVLALYSCKIKSNGQEDENDQITSFLQNNDTLHFTRTASGLYYRDIVVGTGSLPVTHDSVFIIHTIQYLNGNIIFSSEGTTDTLGVTLNEGTLIAGFEEALTYMREGGKAVFLVPSSLAYGPEGWLNIPGYTPLLFWVYLSRVHPYPFSK